MGNKHFTANNTTFIQIPFRVSTRPLETWSWWWTELMIWWSSGLRPYCMRCQSLPCVNYLTKNRGQWRNSSRGLRLVEWGSCLIFVFYLWVVVCLYGTERGSWTVLHGAVRCWMGHMLIPLCVCYSFNVSLFVFIQRRQNSKLSCMKYLFLGEFLLLAQQNTKCHDLGILAAVADPGFPVEGCGPHRRECGLLRWLHFKNFVCQNKRIGTLRGVHTGHTPLDLPMSWQVNCSALFMVCFYSIG